MWFLNQSWQSSLRLVLLDADIYRQQYVQASSLRQPGNRTVPNLKAWRRPRSLGKAVNCSKVEVSQSEKSHWQDQIAEHLDRLVVWQNHKWNVGYVWNTLYFTGRTVGNLGVLGKLDNLHIVRFRHHFSTEPPKGWKYSNASAYDWWPLRWDWLPLWLQQDMHSNVDGLHDPCTSLQAQTEDAVLRLP